MTKEEVKAQLDKCPLEWKEEHTRFGERVFRAPLRIGELSLEMRIHYEPGEESRWAQIFIKHMTLVLMALAHREEAGEILMRKVNDLPTLDEVKAQAEAHRLELVCRLLNIED